MAGALLALWLMGWAIVALSCLVGAGVIVDALNPDPVAGLLIFAILGTAGATIQMQHMKKFASSDARPGEGSR